MSATNTVAIRPGKGYGGSTADLYATYIDLGVAGCNGMPRDWHPGTDGKFRWVGHPPEKAAGQIVAGQYRDVPCPLRLVIYGLL